MGALLLLFNRLLEEDFAVLRGPLESGRQSPGTLSGVLILFLILQPLMFFLAHIVGGDLTNYPDKNNIFTVHFWITVILMFLSIIYAIRAIYMKSQKAQYLLIILVSQNVATVCSFIMVLFLIGENREITKGSLMNFTYVTLFFGLLIFIVTSIRFYLLLRKGHYRKGSKKDELRGRFETKSYLPVAIIGSTGLVFIIQFIVRIYGLADLEEAFIIVILMLIFFTMIFVLPEQLVILYCKFRFDSFNYSKKGKLKPFNNKSKGAGK